MQRTDLASHSDVVFDLIIVGGGINGVAIARDAAMRGMTVVLLERDDLASGTSAWSSRLIHGGLRYLEHREFGLVRESLRERELLLRNAPHLVDPLGMIVPIYDGAKRGPVLIRAGMALYDALSYDKSLPLHRMLSQEQVLERLPGLDPTGLRAGARYYDAQATFPERLVVEQAISAWNHGAQIATRARVTGIIAEGAVVRGVTGTDELTGEEFRLRGRIVINVAGPWVDQVLLGAPQSRVPHRLIGGTKGSHLVIERWDGAPDEAIYYESRADRRPILIIPWNGMILLGSTDLRFGGDLDDVTVSEAEVTYLLNEVNTLYPGLRLTSNDVLYSYAGVRPLPHAVSGSTAAITRRHIVKDHAPALRGLWSVVGGKLTTHRSLAEEVVNKAIRALGKEAPCRTADTPLPGAAGVAYDVFLRGFVRQAEEAGLSQRTAQRLSAIYGVRADGILTLVRSKPDLAMEIDGRTGAVAAEVAHAVQSELAISLADVLLRRTMLAYEPDNAIGIDQAALDLTGKTLGWSKTRQRNELAAFRSWIARYQPQDLAGAPEPE